MKKSLLIIEILVGLLALIIGLIVLYPLRFFSIRIGGKIMVTGTIILGITLLVIGIFRLSSGFLICPSQERGLAFNNGEIRINVIATSQPQMLNYNLLTP